jgi:hypothetical protein
MNYNNKKRKEATTLDKRACWHTCDVVSKKKKKKKSGKTFPHLDKVNACTFSTPYSKH